MPSWGYFWSLDRKTLPDDEAKAQKFILSEMHTFHLEIHAFHLKCAHFTLKMHKTADFHSNLLVSWELVTEGYQGRPITLEIRTFVHVGHVAALSDVCLQSENNGHFRCVCSWSCYSGKVCNYLCFSLIFFRSLNLVAFKYQFDLVAFHNLKYGDT